MAEKMKMDLGMRQEQRLTPQMVQSMEVLQMNGQELLEYLNRAADENPMLEREEPAVLRREFEQLRGRISWLNGRSGSGTVDVPERGREDRALESLESFLYDQLERLELDSALLSLCRYMVCLLDEEGYLDREDLEGLTELSIPAEMVNRALVILQSLEPAGVAARDLSECLLLQLRRQGEDDGVTLAVAAAYLPQLGRHHYGAIARALHVSEKAVRRAEKKIAALEPHPGRAFETGEEPVYIRPDVFVAQMEGKWQVVLNEYYLPRLTINGQYAKLLDAPVDEATASYLKDRLRRAQWLLYSLSRRGDTLRRCAEAVLARQKAFFDGETGELEPMSLRELAYELEVHPSTVTRCVQGKYLQCRQGTYPLRYFFSLPAGGVSRQAVQHKLLQLIRGEDKAHPLSDEKLTQLLAGQGIDVARRTVAKYREELGVPAAGGRKRG